MKVLPKILVLGVLLAMVLQPVAALCGGVGVPMTKKILPGTTTINYSGQELRFSTSVTLVVKFTPVSELAFEMSVYQYGGSQQIVSEQAAGSLVEIDASTLGEEIYNGPAPTESNPFEGIFHSESGFTEK